MLTCMANIAHTSHFRREKKTLNVPVIKNSCFGQFLTQKALLFSNGFDGDEGLTPSPDPNPNPIYSLDF